MLYFTFILSLVFALLLVGYLIASDMKSRRWLGPVSVVALLAVCIISLIRVDEGNWWNPNNWKSNIRYGLDIQGGTQFTVELGGEVTPALRDQAVSVIRKRIDGMGLAEPLIQPAGDNRIIVQIPGVSEKDKNIYRNQLERVAKLEFRLVHPESEKLIEESKRGLATLPFDYEILPLLDHDENGKVTKHEILVKRRAEMSGKYVKNAFRSIDQLGRSVVIIAFNDEGEKEFGALTEQHIGDRLAIVLDNEVYSAPVIRSAIMGNCEISGGSMTATEAEELASVLQNPLETPVKILDERGVDPSLGKASIESGFRAGWIALAAIMVFAVVYYRFAGVVAAIALALNMVILLGLLAQFGFTLTMPGIAGIVLTIAMAVDANVLIYERIREELAWGKPLVNAIETGFHRAFSCILDANVTTIIAAAILFWQGSGPVQGFAITLCLGVLSSMFTALIASRSQFEWLLHFKILKSLSMAHFFSKQPNFQFMKIRWIAMMVSGLIILASMVGWQMKGHTVYGVDFVGGDLLTLGFDKKIPDDQIRGAAKGEEVLAQYMRTPAGGGDVLSIRTPFGYGEKFEQLLEQKFPEAHFKRLSLDKVEGLIGNELKQKAIIALTLGAIGTFIYTMIRFNTSYAVGAVVAIIHDVLISLGIFVLLGHELSLPVVGAILTVAGYSINDTIVIYDRIREGLKMGYKGTLEEVMNTCINLTLSRTLITAGTTFLAVLALYLFGGVVIQDFALILLVGIVVGTYSSIFIASPIALLLAKKKT